jgi:hypothetical protein
VLRHSSTETRDGYVEDSAGTSLPCARFAGERRRLRGHRKDHGARRSLARHDPVGKSVEAGNPRGIRNPYGAEVHLIIRNEGFTTSDLAEASALLEELGHR